MYANRQDPITPIEIDLIVQELVVEQGAAFENYYTSLTHNQCAVLLAIAHDKKVKSPMSNNFIKKHELPAISSIKTALKTLIERQFIIQYQGCYIVYDRFFALWLRNINR